MSTKYNAYPINPVRFEINFSSGPNRSYDLIQLLCFMDLVIWVCKKGCYIIFESFIFRKFMSCDKDFRQWTLYKCHDYKNLMGKRSQSSGRLSRAQFWEERRTTSVDNMKF